MSLMSDQATYWNDTAGPRWVANQVRLDAIMAPLTEALITVAAPRAGDHVLDIGCGCGDLSLQIATRVGRSGRVAGVDVSTPMLAHAESRARAWPEPHAPLTWHHGDAATHEFDTTFDLLVSRFGVMFFEDTLAAFRQLRKAAGPDARLNLLAWRARAEVEWMQAPLDWIESVVPVPDSSEGEPGPFGLADGQRTCDLLNAAGFHDVEPMPIDRVLTIGATVEEALTALRDTGPAAGALRDAEPDVMMRAETLMRDGLSRQKTSEGVQLRAACWLYRARG